MTPPDELIRRGEAAAVWYAGEAAKRLDGPAALALVAGDDPSRVVELRRTRVVEAFDALIGELERQLVVDGEEPHAVAKMGVRARAAFQRELNRSALAMPIPSGGHA